jgi:ubiquinone/menaquinone biosynthesis C-methylase UbiE
MKSKTQKMMFGGEMDRMPDWSFRIMAMMFNIADWLHPPHKRLDPFNILPGQTVIDWGCGTGRYLKPASEKAGPTGTVYAVDIQPLAVESARKMIRKFNLQNVRPVLTDGKTVDIPGGTADLIFALDMFHMVSDPTGFLKLLHSLSKTGGRLILEDGHQPRAETRRKILDAGCWIITSETKTHVECFLKDNEPARN